MKLATMRTADRDGALIVVSRDLQRYLPAPIRYKNLQSALDQWADAERELSCVFEKVQKGEGLSTEKIEFHSPSPRAYEWIDGSAYINHVVLVRKARGAEPPETLTTDPLIYQGGSGVFLGPTEPIKLADEKWGCDFESEVCVVLGDTPQGTLAKDAHRFIKLVMICNDVSLRNLIPNELAKGFGFFCSKPASAFSPIAVTPDELGSSWKDCRVHLPLVTHLNGKKFGDPDAGSAMHFSFADLIQHICKTRSYTAGTILGSGTVSNEDRNRGSSCLAEKRMLETIDTGAASTPFLKHGDRVEIEMFDLDGKSIFGKISQIVTSCITHDR